MGDAQPPSERTTMKRGPDRAVYGTDNIKALLAQGMVAHVSDAIDEEHDMDGPHWAGVVPLTSTFGAPIPAADLRGDPPIPDAVAGLEGTNPHGVAPH